MAGLVTVAQLLAAAAYASVIAFTTAPEPFSFEDWAFLLLPPVLFAALLVTGLFGVTSHRLAIWQRILSAFGCIVVTTGLVLTLILLPIGIFGSFMDYTIG